MLLKLSTARNRPVLLVGSADHVTGLTGATLTITASKDGGAFAAITPTVTELAGGWYSLALTTAHTGTLGALALHVTAASADPTDVLDEVVADLPGVLPAVTTDWLTGAGVKADAVTKVQAGLATPTNITAGTLTTVTTATNVTTVNGLAANTLTAAALATDAVAKIQAGLSTYAGGPVASVSGDVGGKVLGGGAGVISGTGARVVDHLGNDVAPVATALTNVTWTDARAGKLDNADVPTSGVAAAVWAVGTRTLTGFGSLVSDVSAAVWSAVGRTLTAFGFTVPATVAGPVTLTAAYDPAKTAAQPGDPMALTTPAGNALVAATAAQVTADHGAGDYRRNTEPLDAAGVRSAVGLASANLDTQLAEIESETDDVAAVKAKTDQLTFTVPNHVDATGGSSGTSLTAQQTRDALLLAPSAGTPAAGSVDAELDAIQAKTDALGTAAVTVVSPISPDGKTLSLTHGDDYGGARAFGWTDAGGTWPDLTGAAVALNVANGALVIPGTVTVASGAGKAVSFAPTPAQTGALPPRSYAFDVRFVLADGSPVTRIRGTLHLANSEAG